MSHDWYSDVDDLDFLWWSSPDSSSGCLGLGVFLVIAIIAFAWVLRDSNTCASQCAPLEADVLDHRCVCFEPNGDMHLAPNVP